MLRQKKINLYKNILRDFIRYLPSKLIPALIGILSVPIFTRLLSLEKYGEFQIFYTSLIIISSIFFSWIPSMVTRFYIRVEFNFLYKFLKSTLYKSIFVGIISWLLYSLFFVDSPNYYIIIISGILWLFAQANIEFYSSWLRVINLFKEYSYVSSLRSLIGLTISVYLIYSTTLDGWGIILGQVFSMILIFVFLPKIIIKKDKNVYKSLDSSETKSSILKFGIHAAFINIITTLLSVSDRHIINFFHGEKLVAIYSASYDLSEKTVFFMNAVLILSSSARGIKIFDEQGENKAIDFLNNLLKIYVLLVPGIVFGVCLLYPQIANILFPEEYYAGVSVFPIVAIGGVLIGIMHRYSLLLTFHKKNNLILKASIIAFISNLLLCFVLIPRYAIIGASISTTIAYGIWFLAIKYYARKFKSPSFPFKSFIKVLVILTLLFFLFNWVVSVVEINSIIEIISAFIVYNIIYYFLLLIFGEINFNQIFKSK